MKHSKQFDDNFTCPVTGAEPGISSGSGKGSVTVIGDLKEKCKTCPRARLGSAFPLCSVAPGRKVKIVRSSGGKKMESKLTAMGMYPGSEVRVLENHGGPMIVEVKGSRLSLGCGVAAKIMVDDLP